MGDQRTAKHLDWIDWTRAVCCVAVVYLHTWSSSTIPLDDQAVAKVGFARLVSIEVLQTVLTRFAVPIFFMITGYLLLAREKEVGLDRVKRYALRMVAILATLGYATCLQRAWKAGFTTMPDLALRALLYLYIGNSWRFLWYVYALLGIYLVMPLLKVFASHAEKSTYLFVLGVLFCLTLVAPTIENLTGMTLSKLFPLNGSSSLFYVMLGGYVRIFDVRLTRRLAVVSVAGVLASIAGQVMLMRLTGGDGVAFRKPECPLLMPYALLAFLLMRRAFERRPGVPRVVKSLSANTFAIYLVHPVLIHLLYFEVHVNPRKLPVGGGLVVCLGLLAVAWALASLLRRVPGVRNVLS